MTLAFKLTRATDQIRLPCEFGANLFSSFRDISYTKNHRLATPKQNLLQFTACGNYCVRRRFITTSFFLVDGYAYSRSFCGFFCVVAVNIFSSVNKMVLTSLGEYFSNCFEWLSVAWKFDSLSALYIAIFDHRHFTSYSVGLSACRGRLQAGADCRLGRRRVLPAKRRRRLDVGDWSRGRSSRRAC